MSRTSELVRAAYDLIGYKPGTIGWMRAHRLLTLNQTATAALIRELDAKNQDMDMTLGRYINRERDLVAELAKQRLP